MASKKIKVLIVDDSKLYRTLFTGLLSQTDDIEVVGSAEDPFDAREKIKQLQPDVITLDVEMPKMDGISFLDKLMKLRPMPVVMVSTLTTKEADVTLKALEIGAVDCIAKPGDINAASKTMDAFKHDMADKIRIASVANINRQIISPRIYDYSHPIEPMSRNKQYKLIAIGASTGGVEAIRAVICSLPKNSPPVIITQHMPEKFTDAFAKRLDNICELSVCEATDNGKIQAGHVYIAPGGLHLKIETDSSGSMRTRVFDGDLVSGHKPSVDVMMDSIAAICPNQTIGVILTGMGKDGANGLLKIKQNGGYTIGQSEGSCVVYGMPKAAKNQGAIDVELPLTQIADEIIRKCQV